MHNIITIKCIVEGHGENEAVPELLRRIGQDHAPHLLILSPQPIRQTRSRLLREGELERCVTLAARQLTTQGGILILIDSDDDCPASIGPALLARAQKVVGHRSISVNLAHREFESWFLAAAPSLANAPGFPSSIPPVPDPERIRGAKERITDLMIADRVYREAVDQKRLARIFDMGMAERSASFRRFRREVIRLINAATE
jgi:hypothetical protein